MKEKELMGRGYFSIKEFQTFVCAMTEQTKLHWLSLAGDVLNEKDSTELQSLLEDFFRKRGHRSFRKHLADVLAVRQTE